MTDYHYQATARDDPTEDEGEDRFADAHPRRSTYPPEDEAFWAEAGASPPAQDEPLWYEDRLRRAETRTATGPDGPGREAPSDPSPRWAETDVPLLAEDEPATESHWADADADSATEEWREAAADGTEPAGAWPADADAAEGWSAGAGPDDDGTPGYVAGAAAAAGLAAAELGERRIRFDPTKERGTASYDRAARHSQRVRILKIALPTVALLAVAGFFAILSIDPEDDGLPALTLNGINVESRQITMDTPKISGFDGTKQAYEVRAVKATQDLGNPKVVTLEQIVARFAIGDDVRANIEAATGIYDGNTQKLKLKGGIALTTTNGYAAQLEEADIDVEKGAVASDTGVMIKGKEGSLTAKSIEVLDRGKHILFKGDVKIVYHPPETAEGAETSGDILPAASPAIAEAAPDG